MIPVLIFAFNAIAPILILILIGYFCRKSGFISLKTMKEMNRLNFRFSFFCLMFINLYGISDISEFRIEPLIFMMSVIVLLTVLGLVLSGYFTEKRERRGVLIQSAFRSNYAIIGTPMVESLAGGEGVLLATFFQLPLIMYFNIVSVITYSIFSEREEKTSVGKVILGCFKNPIILGLLTGSLALVIREFIPLDPEGLPVFSLERDIPWLYKVMLELSRAATPLALISLGGQLEIGEIKSFKKELSFALISRLIAAPLIGFSLAFLLDSLGIIEIDKVMAAVMVVAFGSPLAVSSAAMAAEMGADDALAGQVVVWSSIISMLTLFIISGLLKFMGIL